MRWVLLQQQLLHLLQGTFGRAAIESMEKKEVDVIVREIRCSDLLAMQIGVSSSGSVLEIGHTVEQYTYLFYTPMVTLHHETKRNPYIR